MTERRMCVLEDGKVCDDCGQCNLCDLDPTKICDNCMKSVSYTHLDVYKRQDKRAAQPAAAISVVGHALGDDVARAAQRRFNVYDALLLRDKPPCLRFERSRKWLLKHEQRSERGEAHFGGNRGARSALLTVRPVEVLERCERIRRSNLCAQLRGQGLLFIDQAQDFSAALVERTKAVSYTHLDVYKRQQLL